MPDHRPSAQSPALHSDRDHDRTGGQGSTAGWSESEPAPATSFAAGLRIAVKAAFPGVMICFVIAAAARFLADHYGAPQMLFALLLGLAFHFLSEDEKMAKGLDIAARPLLRIGVALLGLRITVQDIAGLGWKAVAFVLAGVLLTLGLGIALARFMRRDTAFGILSGGSVGICGVSAALALASVLPPTEKTKMDTIFVIVTVTVLSTLAMIFYPIFVTFAGFSAKQSAIFLGATIHDVAQVVGAGYGISGEVGDGATIIKLLRVAMLVPVVFVLSVIFRDRSAGKRGLSVPHFIVAFCILALMNTLGLVPGALAAVLSEVSRWMLVAAIVAIGIKTSLQSILRVGPVPVTIMIAETVFLAGWILLGVLALF